MSATVEKALQLVEALSNSPAPIGISQLGRDLKLNKSTVYRLVDTLCRHNYVRQDPQSGRYSLTTKLWEMGVGVVQRLELRDIARPTLEAIARETGEATLLGIIQDHEVLVLDKVDSRQPLQIFSRLGGRVALHCTSIGRALLAFQSNSFINEILAQLPRRTERTITSRAALNLELERIRKLEVAECIDEWAVGVTGVAAPIRDMSGAVVGSLCITGPTSRLTADYLPKLRRLVVDGAHEISRVMGYGKRVASIRG